MNEKELIFLWGMPGSGKSTLGKKLASYLKFNWVDTDSFIEQQYSRSITEIFSNEGEEAFRNMEKDCLQEFLNHEKTVFSCGGGFPIFNNNWEKMLKNGFCIYLNAEISLLSQRIREGKEQRPLLKEQVETIFLEKLSKIFSERKLIYERANLSIKIPVKTSKSFILQASSSFNEYKNQSKS